MGDGTQTTLDPFALEVRSDPYPTYARLREMGPVHRSRLGTWLLTRHADIERVLRDPERFSSDASNSDRLERRGPVADVLGAIRGGADGDRRGGVMLFVDPPDHTRLRTLVNKAFTPRSIEALRPRIQEIVDELLDRAAERGEMDVIEDLAYPLPVAVICEMIGVPQDDRDNFKGWSSAIAGMLDPVYDPAELQSRMQGVAPTFVQLVMYFTDLIDKRRRDPRDDVLSALIAAEDGGDALSHGELMGMLILLFIAGHETTLNLIGNGTLALLRHPDEVSRLRSDATLVRSAVEELLRYDSPVQLTARTVMEDVEIAGHRIGRGEGVTCLLGSANRDAAVFAGPDRLDVGRTENRHLSFGGGPHFCLGAPLARAEGHVAISTLLRRFGAVELAGEPLWRDTFTLRGLSRLPVRLEPAKSHRQ